MYLSWSWIWMSKLIPWKIYFYCNKWLYLFDGALPMLRQIFSDFSADTQKSPWPNITLSGHKKRSTVSHAPPTPCGTANQLHCVRVSISSKNGRCECASFRQFIFAVTSAQCNDLCTHLCQSWSIYECTFVFRIIISPDLLQPLVCCAEAQKPTINLLDKNICHFRWLAAAVAAKSKSAYIYSKPNAAISLWWK